MQGADQDNKSEWIPTLTALQYMQDIQNVDLAIPVLCSSFIADSAQSLDQHAAE